MAIIDVLIIIIIFAFMLLGFVFGFIHALGSLIGTAVALLISGIAINPISEKLTFVLGGGITTKILIFLALFLIVSHLIGFLFSIAEKIFHFLYWIPFAKTIDRILGSVFGLIEGIIVCGIVLFLISQILPDNALKDMISSSVLGETLIGIVVLFKIFLPEIRITK